MHTEAGTALNPQARPGKSGLRARQERGEKGGGQVSSREISASRIKGTTKGEKRGPNILTPQEPWAFQGPTLGTELLLTLGFLCLLHDQTAQLPRH